MKHDIATAVIYCYITTDFHYSKCDSCLSTYGGVMLQRVCIEKNVNRHFSLNFTKFCNKSNWPQCLVVFFIAIQGLRFSAIWNLLNSESVKMAQNSFQHFPRCRFWWGHYYHSLSVDATVMVLKIAQSLVNTLVLFSWQNRLLLWLDKTPLISALSAYISKTTRWTFFLI